MTGHNSLLCLASLPYPIHSCLGFQAPAPTASFTRRGGSLSCRPKTCMVYQVIKEECSRLPRHTHFALCYARQLSCRGSVREQVLAHLSWCQLCSCSRAAPARSFSPLCCNSRELGHSKAVNDAIHVSLKSMARLPLIVIEQD